VDLAKGEKLALLGFDFRRALSNNGVWRAPYTPRMKKRTALLAKLREIFPRFMSQPVERVIERINPILRGWVNYFAVGHSSRCFSLVKDGWKRRSGGTRCVPGSGMASAGSGGVGGGSTAPLGCSRSTGFGGGGDAENQSRMIGHINFEMKQAGKPSAVLLTRRSRKGVRNAS
jgi:Group II intron, maturase-specific domain